MLAMHVLASPQANSQPLLPELVRQLQSGQPLAPGIPLPAMQQPQMPVNVPPFTTPASQTLRPDRFQQQGQTAAQAPARSQTHLHELQFHRRQVLEGPAPAGSQHLPIGELNFGFLQLVTNSAEVMS